MAVFTAEALEGLKASAHDPEGVTFTRLLAFFLQMGMNGLMLFGMKESMWEAGGAKEISVVDSELYAEAKEAKIASGVAEDPFEFSMNRRAEKLSEKEQLLSDRLDSELEIGNGAIKVGKREVTASNLASLQRVRKTEDAIILDMKGQRSLVDVGAYNGGMLPSYAKRLLMHSHPFDYGTGIARLISPEDIFALKFFNQEYSYMVLTDGTVFRFTKETFPLSEGTIVRELKSEGWINPKSK